MKQFAEKLIKNNSSCYFISPSFGDAASSVGELMEQIAGKVDMTVINIFTSSGDGKNTFSARQFLKSSGQKNPQTIYALRKQEDANALAPLDVTIHNLDIIDALWRKKNKTGILTNLFSKYIPELDRRYPTYPFHILSGRIVKDDQAMIHTLKEKLRSIIPNRTNIAVFCPIGFGQHVDYLLIRDLCQELFAERCIFYSLPIEDTKDAEKNTFLKKHKRTPILFTTTSEMKVKLLKAYTSQEEQFFNGNGLVFRPEQYYVQKKQIKRDLHVVCYNALTKSLLKEWQTLWKNSERKNFFNSPSWFVITTQIFRYTKPIFLACYSEKKLVGILPLILDKKYGIAAYMSPGNQYYDNSSLLIQKNDSDVISALLTSLRQQGSFYLAEIPRAAAMIASIHFPKLGITESSKCPYLVLKSDPYRFLSKKNKRILMKKFKDAGGNFSCKLYIRNAGEHIKTMLDIDKESTKVAEHKATFSDPQLIQLVKTIDKHSLAIALLYYKDEPVCYNYGFIVDQTYVSVGTAFKESWKHLAPGRALGYLLLPELIKNGITLLDFSRGYTRYKTDFAPYAYHQYALFYSQDTMAMKRWMLLEFIKHSLEKYPALFEFARKSKTKLFKPALKQHE